MALIQEGDVIIPEFIEGSYDCSKIFDISGFFTPAECSTSKITYFKELSKSTIRLEPYKIEQSMMHPDSYEEFSCSDIFDLSDIKAAEIEIEDEIRMGYFWGKYSKIV